ncbi:uncharacterized protein FIBRA_01238 [Fibroporia radiculosa]|uniref:N-acetyltransferase domain-containing protein n=1 Tax=Fibroporia radiculosa TaxID=599839 RepID=J4G0V7_9APHY|nr:uncharacterized protein FIBRA_01238 [Fibroporia radiculosa]CCL99223.1 predicted protein [Fibroporia radiculosa]
MSAYGVIAATNRSGPLASTQWGLASKPESTYSASTLTIHHTTLASAQAVPGLVSYLRKVFADELERGMTYPQEILSGQDYSQDMFEAYYFAADVLIAVLDNEDPSRSQDEFTQTSDGSAIEGGIEQAIKGRGLEECIAGCYYICNAGFLVPPSQRGKGIGAALARSFLYYAPRLGYEASVFNLVYVNNVASVRLWEALNFTKAGRIPRAGRLKKADGSGEEFVDAWVFYRRFDPVQ